MEKFWTVDSMHKLERDAKRQTPCDYSMVRQKVHLRVKTICALPWSSQSTEAETYILCSNVRSNFHSIGRRQLHFFVTPTVDRMVSSCSVARDVQTSAFFYMMDVVDRRTDETDMSRDTLSSRVALRVRSAIRGV
ncbi:hypothetical protein J6590_064288 [Homalodisca vitripennis]|nr:hypothetical protein J6590_064288 [Homalodisca vitripennis]